MGLEAPFTRKVSHLVQAISRWGCVNGTRTDVGLTREKKSRPDRKVPPLSHQFRDQAFHRNFVKVHFSKNVFGVKPKFETQ